MLKKSYPMRYHEERPSSIDELHSPKDRNVPDRDESGLHRTGAARKSKETPAQIVLVLSKELAEARGQRAAALSRQSGQSWPPASPEQSLAERPPEEGADLAEPESPENHDPHPTAFDIYTNWPLDHHRRKCTVCNHPWRSAIEEEFVHWASPDAISHHYNVGWRAVYRHAHAMGLFEKRGHNLRSALGHVIEHANHVAPGADTVVRAIRAYACVNSSGKWIEPTKHVLFSSDNRTAEPLSDSTEPAAADPSRNVVSGGKHAKGGKSNRQSCRLETGLNLTGSSK